MELKAIPAAAVVTDPTSSSSALGIKEQHLSPSSSSGGSALEGDAPEVATGNGGGSSSSAAAATASSSCCSVSNGSLMGVAGGELKQLLLFFVILKIAGSFDSGAFSAAIGSDNGITDDLALTTTQQGTLGASVFLGNMVGCAVAGHLFSVHRGKLVLLSALVLHTFMTFLFVSVSTYHLSLVSRFGVGFSLAFIVVYTPLWVDEFAPTLRASSWMAYQNAGVPVGIMLGYVLGGLIPGYTDLTWKLTFYMKVVGMIPIMIFVARVDPKRIDIRRRSGLSPMGSFDSLHGSFSGREGHSSSPGSNVDAVTRQASLHAIAAAPLPSSIALSLGEQARRLARSLRPFTHNGVFVCCVLSLSSLYFVVAGLQTFAMPYLRADPFNASTKDIVLGFGLSVVSAPVFGVVAGGVLLDRIGGYHRNMPKASAFACAWAGLAAMLSLLCMSADTTSSFLVAVWCMLFCGGAVIPPTSGLILASLPEGSRAAGSSISTVVCNLLGNFLGPIVCGWVADRSGTLALGIHLVLAASFVGVVPLVLCVFFAKRAAAGIPPPHHASSSSSRFSAAGPNVSGDGTAGNGSPVGHPHQHGVIHMGTSAAAVCANATAAANTTSSGTTAVAVRIAGEDDVSIRGALLPSEDSLSVQQSHHRLHPRQQHSSGGSQLNASSSDGHSYSSSRQVVENGEGDDDVAEGDIVTPAVHYAMGFTQHSLGLTLVHQLRHLHGGGAGSSDSWGQAGSAAGAQLGGTRQDSRQGFAD
jgi:MFS family permease